MSSVLNWKSPKLKYQRRFQDFFTQASDVLAGKEHQLRLSLCCFLGQGHLLIEDLPGMGKTTLVMALSRLLGLELSRIQFTNDLLPSDILGASIYNSDKKSFEFKKGPIFGEMILGDELNRGTPKTQSAFLQAMEEQKVTVDGVDHPLPPLFFMIATQNPKQQVGTYPLPESQLDRFMMKFEIGYPDKESEKQILSGEKSRKNIDNLKAFFTNQELIALRREASQVHVSPALVSYVQSLLQRSRELNSNHGGLSPRCGVLLIQAAQSWAYLEGRDMVLPEDIKVVAPHVMSHRLQFSSDLEAIAGQARARAILNEVPIP